MINYERPWWWIPTKTLRPSFVNILHLQSIKDILQLWYIQSLYQNINPKHVLKTPKSQTQPMISTNGKPNVPSVRGYQSDPYSLVTGWSICQWCEMQSGQVPSVHWVYPRTIDVKTVQATHISLAWCNPMWLNTKLFVSTIFFTTHHTVILHFSTVTFNLNPQSIPIPLKWSVPFRYFI
jgi:hypothetical protein